MITPGQVRPVLFPHQSKYRQREIELFLEHHRKSALKAQEHKHHQAVMAEEAKQCYERCQQLRNTLTREYVVLYREWEKYSEKERMQRFRAMLARLGLKPVDIETLEMNLGTWVAIEGIYWLYNAPRIPGSIPRVQLTPAIALDAKVIAWMYNPPHYFDEQPHLLDLPEYKEELREEVTKQEELNHSIPMLTPRPYPTSTR